jgi:hypothetical protein
MEDAGDVDVKQLGDGMPAGELLADLMGELLLE